MKKLAKLMMAAMLLFTVTACSSNNSTDNGSTDNGSTEETLFNNISIALIEAIDSGDIESPAISDFLAADWVEANGFKNETEALKQFTGMDAANLEAYAYLQNPMSFGFTRVLMVEAKEGKTDEVKAEIDAFLAKAAGDAFYPEDQDVAQNPETYENGNVFVVVISTEAAAMMDFIKERLD